METSRLYEAVKAGIINQGQADLLADFLVKPVAPMLLGASTQDEEPIEVLNGFAELFLSIGIVLLLVGIAVLSTAVAPFLIPFVSWGLAEALRGWKPTRLPVIVLSVGFIGSVAWVLSALLIGDWDDYHSDDLIISLAGSVFCGAVMFYLRFKTPIVLSFIAAAASAVFLGLLSLVLGVDVNWYYWWALPSGIAILLLALWFDRRDPLRKGVDSDTAFWLHLLAAPMIVHAVVMPLGAYVSDEIIKAVVMIVLVAALSVIALMIDRRAILVSSLTYLGYSIFTLAEEINDSTSTAVSLVIVGVLVIMLAVGWRRARELVMRNVPRVMHGWFPPVRKVSNGG